MESTLYGIISCLVVVVAGLLLLIHKHTSIKKGGESEKTGR